MKPPQNRVSVCYVRRGNPINLEACSSRKCLTAKSDGLSPAANGDLGKLRGRPTGCQMKLRRQHCPGDATRQRVCDHKQRSRPVGPRSLAQAQVQDRKAGALADEGCAKQGDEHSQYHSRDYEIAPRGFHLVNVRGQAGRAKRVQHATERRTRPCLHRVC